ncbi:phage portal protein [Geosporobacter ferrireducens]|uniref:phage portal protein n=1 Tax=Geosporobacter ferrireducens TaxID=1424294 RepID=UPI00139F28CD|nr:phage portal protein [Geosporobacter ferrireducens]MTI56145.1 phage portal protein [Geosporobacter ferrireducens]
MKLIKTILANGAASAMSLEEIIKNEISEWKNSEEYKLMLESQKYYKNDADILKRERMTIGDSGNLEKVHNLASNKLAHGFLKKLVDQKTGYLLSKPMSIQTDNEQYQEILQDYFNKSMLRLIQNIGKEAVIKGKAWLHVYYNEKGNLSFKRIPSEEIIPLWKDQDHTELDAVIRVYQVEAYEGRIKKDITKVEFWSPEGVQRYVYDGNLIPDVEMGDRASHFVVIDQENKEQPANWEKVPFICFKYNNEEISLLKFIKSLIDDYDKRKSDNSNNLEDLPNSIYVVKNYSNTQGGEFRKNISQYRVVFTDENGGVDSVNIEINTEAYKNHMEMNRKDIYEFGRGVDTQGEEFGNIPSGIALKFLYADLDMDANTIESEFQASLEQLLWFINTHIANTTGIDYSEEAVDFIFNRDILINESNVITDIKNSVGILSDETLIANHPYVTDVKEELERIKKQRKENMITYPPNFDPGGVDDEE